MVDVFRQIGAVPAAARGGVLTVGNFDGVHVGHRRILSAARQAADAAGVGVSVLTFDPLPEAVLAPQRVPELICAPDTRFERLGECGADWIVAVAPTRDLLATEPEAFVRDVIVRCLAPRAIVEGQGFAFGRDRSGDLTLLRRLGRESGFDVVEVEPVRLSLPGAGEVRASSSLARQLIRKGDVAAAAEVLGRPHELPGRVVGGEQRGRVLRFPTANVDPASVLTPGDGVYAGWADVAGRRYPAAVSVGTKPTFGPKARTIEANLIDAEGDFYHQPIVLTFLQRLRDQERFPDAESLRQAIAKDVRRVRDICK